jgi:outer membrane cobalamin receptor
MTFRLFPICTFAVLPLLAAAQTAVPPDEVVVTASRLTDSAATTPYPVTVIPRDRLTGRTDVADALSEQSEIYVQSPGGRSGESSIFLRGADPNFTVVLFDGVPLNDPTNTRGGAVNVAAIDASSLERIELVTSPLSSLYGSGSLTGIINLVAPAGTIADQLQATIGAGSGGYWSAAARWRGPMSAGLGGSFGVVTDDDGEQTPRAGFRSRTLTGKIAPLDHENSGRLIVRVNETEAESYPDSSGGSRLATRSALESRKSWEQLVGLSLPVYRGDTSRLDFSVSVINRRGETESPGVAPSVIDPVGIPAGNDLSHYRRVAGQAAARMDLAHWSVGAGVEALRETGSSQGTLVFGTFRVGNSFERQRSTLSGFVEANRAGKLWTFNTGLRVDDVDGLKTRTTARAGARYFFPGSHFSLRAVAGSGFKAPSFYAIGNPFVGNVNLKPEESAGGEIGITWSGAAGDSAAITLYGARYRQLIDFVPGPPPRLENRNLVIVRGVAVTAAHAFAPHWSASLQAQYATTRDDATQQQLMIRPQWRINASLNWQIADSISTTARYRYVGERDDYAIPVGIQQLDAYQMVSFETAWTFTGVTTARVVIDNAFNDHHEDALGFGAPGSSLRLGLSRTF